MCITSKHITLQAKYLVQYRLIHPGSNSHCSPPMWREILNSSMRLTIQLFTSQYLIYHKLLPLLIHRLSSDILSEEDMVEVMVHQAILWHIDTIIVQTIFYNISQKIRILHCFSQKSRSAKYLLFLILIVADDLTHHQSYHLSRPIHISL